MSTFDRIAGAQREPPYLRRRNVDVVGTGEIVGIRGAEKPEAVLQNLDNAGANDVGTAACELLQDAEHQLLLAEGAGVFDLELFREGKELGRRFCLEVLKLHFRHAFDPWVGRGPIEL